MGHGAQEQHWMQGSEPPEPLVHSTEMLQCILIPGVWLVFWMPCQQLLPRVVQARGMGGSLAQ